jgi:hypothetical protein
METFLGLVENNRFNVLVPEAAHCCTVKLTRVEQPAISDDAVSSHAIDLAEYEGSAIMVRGVLPEHKGYLYEAQVIDKASPILTAVVQKLFVKK